MMACAALALGACGDDDDGGSGGGYPDEARNNFLKACEAQRGATRAVCECSLEKIEDKYSYDEFKKIDQRAREGEDVSGEIRTIAESCAKEEG